jgi:nucleotide-binding universal stress UspA family protein
MFHDILVSIDGSAYADKALTEAIELAEAGHGRLTILTAVHVPPSLAEATIGWGPAAGELAVEVEREYQELLRRAEMRVPKNISLTTILSHDPIRRALSDAIESGHYDLVAMGSRGRGPARAALLGSVSHYVLNHSAIPVLIVPGDWASAAPTQPEHASDGAFSS